MNTAEHSLDLYRPPAAPSVSIRVHPWFQIDRPRQSPIQSPKSKVITAFAAEVSAVPVEGSPQSLARSLVQDDEVIILLLRPSMLYVLLSSLGGLAFIAVVTFALAYMARTISWVGWSDTAAFALGVGLATLRLGWQTLEWLSRVYVLTDRRIITRSGVLRVVVFQTQLRNIQHTSVFFRLRERLCGLGTIGFATAGSDSFESFWVMLKQPHVVHRTIVDAIRKYGK
jgi:hypothetical protein